VTAAPLPGAAPERTALAWRRTSLAFAVNGVLLVRTNVAWIQVAALAVLAFATAIAAFSGQLFRRPPMTAGRRRGVAIAVAGALVGLLDLIAIIIAA
jgi:putative membrane protein